MYNSGHNSQQNVGVPSNQPADIQLYEDTCRFAQGDASTERFFPELAKILWSSGPVTFIALHLGHWCTFGKFAHHTQFIYFGSYTLIAGIMTLTASRFVSTLRNNFRETKGENRDSSTEKIVEKLCQLNSDEKKKLIEILRLIEIKTKGQAES